MKPGRALALFCLLSTAAGAEDFAGPETCQSCHQKEYEEWKSSLHARAYSPHFKRLWQESGKKSECLACHTTGHERSTSKFAFEGVTCESCHGAYPSDHPGSAKMSLAVDASLCAACHAQTHREWKVSAHGQKNIRCFDCHNVHAQGLRIRPAEALCGSCHPGRLKSFAHATHHQKGLTCLTCHFPEPEGARERLAGAGAASHNLAVGAEICARCHRETVHRSQKLEALRGEVSDLQAKLESPEESARQWEKKAESLEWELSRTRSRQAWLAALAWLLGIAMGMALILKKGKNGR